jgi:hypothetical protein
MGVSGQCHTPAALYPWGKGPLYPLDMRLGGSQGQSGHIMENKWCTVTGRIPRILAEQLQINPVFCWLTRLMDSLMKIFSAHFLNANILQF